MVGDRAVERERDPARMAAGELDREASQLGGERDVRAEQLEILGADDRDVERVRDEPALERCDDLLGDDHARSVLRLLGRGGEVGRHDDVLELEQLAGVRLGREDVERGARDLPVPDGLRERALVDELAAGGVDDPDAVAHLGERPGVDEVPGLVGERQVQGQELGRGEDLRRVPCVLRPELAETLRSDERVVADDAHAEAERAAGDLPPDPAEAEHAERLVRELDPAPARALPAAVLERGVRLRDVARERDEQADRVLRGGDDRRVRRVRDDDPASRCRLDVDVVDADAGAADHLQPLGALDHVGGQLRRRADHDRVVAADDLGERRVGVLVDVEARAQQIDAGGGDRLPHEDLQTGVPSA